MPKTSGSFKKGHNFNKLLGKKGNNQTGMSKEKAAEFRDLSAYIRAHKLGGRALADFLFAIVQGDVKKLSIMYTDNLQDKQWKVLPELKDRIKAAEILLQRGYGSPPQEVSLTGQVTVSQSEKYLDAASHLSKLLSKPSVDVVDVIPTEVKALAPVVPENVPIVEKKVDPASLSNEDIDTLLSECGLSPSIPGGEEKK